METVGFRNVEWQVISQDATLGRFALQIACPAMDATARSWPATRHQEFWTIPECRLCRPPSGLGRSAPHRSAACVKSPAHPSDRFVPVVGQRLPRAGKRDRGHEPQFEPGHAGRVHQHTVIVAGGLKADPNRQSVLAQDRSQAHKVIGAVGDCQAPKARLARGGNQHLVPVFRNVSFRVCKYTLQGSVVPYPN